jgi:hypothetical protein
LFTGISGVLIFLYFRLKVLKMRTLVFTDANETQTDLLVKLAKELHLKVEVMDDEKMEGKTLLKLAETSFGKEWNSKEDEHWDDFLKTAKDVSKR